MRDVWGLSAPAFWVIGIWRETGRIELEEGSACR